MEDELLHCSPPLQTTKTPWSETDPLGVTVQSLDPLGENLLAGQGMGPSGQLHE